MRCQHSSGTKSLFDALYRDEYDQNMSRIGIILAGGTGTRLHPITRVISKQLLPVYDKPLLYYPLCSLLLAGIREIVVIATPHDMAQYQALLQDGSQWGVQLHYKVQQNPDGLAQAFIIAEDIIQDRNVVLILGDNIFYGQELRATFQQACQQQSGATIFAYKVRDPRAYGVVEFDGEKRPLRIIEKPVQTKSHYAVTGIYFYDNQVVEVAKQLKPSARGELEITDVNQYYLDQQLLKVVTMGRGTAWLDCGTPQSLLQAGAFIETIEQRQGLKIACPEEIAFKMKYIDEQALENLAQSLKTSSYGDYLLTVLAEYEMSTNSN